MNKGVVHKLKSLTDRDTDRQIDNFMQFFNQFPWLGILSTDPDTTGWGTDDICWWINNNTATAIVIKFWNGSATRTVSST